jgi:glucose-1-phosphate cytidylyltransferase
MKVVLFCGGLGMRLREYSESIPKPMVPIGYRPILWHVMRYYAHYGHNDFILCLGYKADSIKQYFLKYDETISNDFVLTNGGRRIDLLASDIQDWKITFVDTGLNSNIGERLRAVRPYLEGETTFLANYSDGVSDLPLSEMIEYFGQQDAIACFAGVAPTQSFHLVSLESGGRVRSIQHVRDTGMRINGGFFVLRKRSSSG